MLPSRFGATPRLRVSSTVVAAYLQLYPHLIRRESCAHVTQEAESSDKKRRSPLAATDAVHCTETDNVLTFSYPPMLHDWSSYETVTVETVSNPCVEHSKGAGCVG